MQINSSFDAPGTYNRYVATLEQKARLGWGKIRRWALIFFVRRRVEVDLARRRGSCNRCGACCKLLYRCPAYDESSGEGKCLIYNDRPGICALFPINEKDLRDRDIVMPEQSCGFYFVREPRPSLNGIHRTLYRRPTLSFRGTAKFFKKVLGGR
jgi:hypothetical protein